MDEMSELRRAIERAKTAKGWSRETLADRSKVGLSSLDRIMAGARKPSFDHLVKLSHALEIDLTNIIEQRNVPQVAPDTLGAYSRGAVRWMEARYLLLRHAFNREGAMVANALAIFWDEERACLAFVRSDSADGPIIQRGEVSFSTQTGHSYLVANEMGRFDLTILGRPGEGGRLPGLCTTTYLHHGAPTPASSAMVLVPLSHCEDLPAYGLFERDHATFDRYATLVRAVERNGFCKVVGQLT